jgi:hypothetical protein
MPEARLSVVHLQFLSVPCGEPPRFCVHKNGSPRFKMGQTGSEALFRAHPNIFCASSLRGFVQPLSSIASLPCMHYLPITLDH